MLEAIRSQSPPTVGVIFHKPASNFIFQVAAKQLIFKKIMKYPQAYLVIHKDFVMPPLETLKAWAQPCQDIYFPRISEAQKQVDQHTAEIRGLHRRLAPDSSKHTQMIVLHCKEISENIYKSLQPHIIKIYWVDDPSFSSIFQDITDAADAAIGFNRSISDASAAYDCLVDILYDLTAEELCLDESVEIFLNSKMLGEQTMAEKMIKRIFNSVTHADSQFRSDL